MDMTEEQPERPDREQDVRTGRAAARNRMREQAQYVDLQIQQAMARGDFDNLPGAGKPIRGPRHRARPRLVGQAADRARADHRRPAARPPAPQGRRRARRAASTRSHAESEVREEVEEFNARVIRARYTPVDGPPLITQPRDVDAEVERAGGRDGRATRPGRTPPTEPTPAPRETHAARGWFRRGDRVIPTAAGAAARFRRMRSAKDFFRPLAVGAPDPLTEIPARPSRAIHFFDPSNEKMAAKVPADGRHVDVLLGNLEDAVKADNKEAARAGLVKIAQETADLGDSGPPSSGPGSTRSTARGCSTT